MRRLGLSKEVQKTNIVTNDRKVLELRSEIIDYRNNHEVVKARIRLEQLKEKVCLEIPENKQYVMEAEASLDLMEGKITEEEFVLREERALRCTLDTKKLYELDEVFLTEMELACIRQKIQGLDHAEKRKQIDFLLHFFEKFEGENRISDYIAMYEYVMVCVTSELGNMGEYQLATELDKKALREVMKCRRLYEIHSLIYDILWNEKEQELADRKQSEKEKMTDGLKQCIILSHFCKWSFSERIYHDKLFQSLQEDE